VQGTQVFNKTAHQGYPTEYIPISSLSLVDGIFSFEEARLSPALDELVGGGLWGWRLPKMTDDTTAGWEVCVGVGGKLKQRIYRTVDKRL